MVVDSHRYGSQLRSPVCAGLSGLAALGGLIQDDSEDPEKKRQHIQLVEQYTDLKELDARILNRLIEKILVHQRGVDEEGCPMQMIEIYYRFIGRIEIDMYDLFCPAA